LVLILFGWLVASHHTKLYSPTDFPDKEGFFRALTPFEQKQRIDEEIQTMTAELQSVDSFKISQGEAKNQISLAIPNLRSKYMVAEELVFRELEAEFKWPANRQVGIFGADLGIDGAIMTRDQFIAVEIKFTQRPNWNRLVQSALSHISKIANHLHRGSRFLLVVISQGLSEEERASASVKNRQLLKNAEQDIELKAYDYDELAKKYGLCESTYRDREEPHSSPLPHHRTYGSRIRRFGWSKQTQIKQLVCLALGNATLPAFQQLLHNTSKNTLFDSHDHLPKPFGWAPFGP
jgi:hypothetical protein